VKNEINSTKALKHLPQVTPKGSILSVPVYCQNIEQLSCPHVTSRKDLKSLKNKMLLLDFLLKKKVISDQRFEIKSINNSVIKASGLFQGFNETLMKASEEQSKKVEKMERSIIEKDKELRKNIADKDRLELKLAESEEEKRRKMKELELECARKVILLIKIDWN